MKVAFKFLMSLLLVCLVAGCTTNKKPRFNNEDGQVQQFRRYTGRPAADLLFRWDDRAFARVDSDIDGVRFPDMLDVLDRHGRPDYKREDVKARRNEIFDEWVYWDRNVLCQFIQGQLVYEGPLLDSDKYLVNLGYPSTAYFQQYEEGPVREIWIYEHVLEAGSRTVSFSDGKLVLDSIN